MPYKSEKIKLTEGQDRRIKLTSAQKEEIRNLYAMGGNSLNKLAKMFDVSKKTVLLTVNTESAEKARQYRKANWSEWQRKGEEWNAIQREHRAYKHNLYKQGKLKDEED